MGNILINNNYGDNYTVQAGATVVAGGARAAMMREQMFASQQEGTAEAVEECDAELEVDEAAQTCDAERRMQKVRHAIGQMQREKCPGCKYAFFGQGQAYQYAYLFALMNNVDCCERFRLPHFNTATEFVQYLEMLGFERVCSEQTINNRLKLISEAFPNWRVDTGCDTDSVVAKNVASRFLCLYREG